MGAWGEEPMPGSSTKKNHNPAGSSRPDEHNWKPENTGPRDAHRGDIGYGNPGRHWQWSGYTDPGDALQEGPIPGSAKKPLPSQRFNKENSPQQQNQVQDANYNQNNNSSPNNENPIISFLKKNSSQIYSIILEIISLFNSNEDQNTKTNSIFKIINQIMLMFTSASQNDPQPLNPNNQPNNSGKTYANQTNPHQIPPSNNNCTDNTVHNDNETTTKNTKQTPKQITFKDPSQPTINKYLFTKPKKCTSTEIYRYCKSRSPTLRKYIGR